MQYSCLAAAATPNNPQIVELGHIVLHYGCVVPQLAAKVLVVADPQVHHRPVLHVAEGDDLEGHGEGLVGAPVVGQGGAEHIGCTRLHQLARVLCQYLADLVTAGVALKYMLNQCFYSAFKRKILCSFLG